MSLPSAIAFLVLPGPTSRVAELVLSDFERAYGAFARDMASSMGMDPSSVVPKFVRAGDAGGLEAEERGCVCVVIGFESMSDSAAKKALAAIEGAGPMAAGVDGVYSIVLSLGYDAADPGPVHRSLAKACEHAGIAFLGGISLGGGALFEHYARAPRMGTVRHKVSEAVDSLAHAVMAGGGMDVVSARLSLPRFVYERRAGRIQEIR